MLVCMGVGRIFPGGALVDFSKRFSLRGGKSGEICFLPLETKKTTFFAEIINFLPPFRHPGPWEPPPAPPGRGGPSHV